MEEDGKDYGLAQNIEIGWRKEAIYLTEKVPWSKCTTTYPEEYKEVMRQNLGITYTFFFISTHFF